MLTALHTFGFNNEVCQLIEQCISTTFISVLLNGTPGASFKPSRGLRQGDPLSQYLFIICMKIFSRLLLNQEHKKLLHGVKIAPKSEPISHLFFAHDCLLFLKVDLVECRNLLDTIYIFSKASGQIINFEKSGVFFSKKVEPKHKRMMSKLLKINQIDLKDSYLGAPLFPDRSKIKTFAPT